MAESRFKTTEVISSCRKMNNARRSIINELNLMKGIYNSVLLNEWSGGTRIHFHEVVFGRDGESGLIGTMGNRQSAPIGLCKALNDLLYECATYVCSVYNNDNEYIKNYTPINTSMFADNSVVVQPNTNVIDINTINSDSVVINNIVLGEVKSRYKNCLQNITTYINDFSVALKQCISNGINDSSVQALERVANLLYTKNEEFKAQLDTLFAINENMASQANKALNEASQGNSNVADILNQINFD